MDTQHQYRAALGKYLAGIAAPLASAFGRQIGHFRLPASLKPGFKSREMRWWFRAGDPDQFEAQAVSLLHDSLF
jgi:hypothetical protein